MNKLRGKPVSSQKPAGQPGVKGFSLDGSPGQIYVQNIPCIAIHTRFDCHTSSAVLGTTLTEPPARVRVLDQWVDLIAL